MWPYLTCISSKDSLKSKVPLCSDERPFQNHQKVIKFLAKIFHYKKCPLKLKREGEGGGGREIGGVRASAKMPMKITFLMVRPQRGWRINEWTNKQSEQNSFQWLFSKYTGSHVKKMYLSIFAFLHSSTFVFSLLCLMQRKWSER